MTRIPTTPSAIRVPSSQLGAPVLGNVPFGPVPSSPSIGAAIAGAVGGFSAALLERNARMERSVRARQRTELSIENNSLIESALVEAAKVNPEHAEAAFRSRIQDQELKIGQIEDEELRDQASLDFLASSELGLIVVRRAAAKKQAGMQRAVVDAFGGQLVEKVRLGLDPTSAIEEFESHLAENADGFSAEDIVNVRQAFVAQIRAANGQMIRARLTAFSVDLLDKYEAATSDDERSDIIADFAVAIGAAVEAGAIARDTGVNIDQTFQSQAEARIKAKRDSIARRATSRLNAVDSLAIEALVEEANTLPDSQLKTDLLNELASKLTRLNKAKGTTAQKILGILFGGAEGELPQDRLGLNAAYQSVLASNGDVSEFARLLAERGSVFPSDLLRDVAALTDEGTKDLRELAKILRAVGAVRARDLASASSDPDLAFAAMEATPSELDLLSGPLVPDILKTADLQFREDERKKIEGVDIQAAIKSAFKQKITPNTEQLVALKARYFVRFAEFRVTLGDTGDDAEVAQKAAARAAEDIARDFEPVAGVLIRKELIDDLDVSRLVRAASPSAVLPPSFSFVPGMDRALAFFLGGPGPARLDLLFRANGKVYVPIVTETGPTSFIEVDPLDYKSRRIERGTDEFTTLENQLRSNVAPVDFDPFSDLQWREDYGVTSIQEYDELFGARFGLSLADRTRITLLNDGALDGLSLEQQKDAVSAATRRIARRLGWESIYKPKGSGE